MNQITRGEALDIARTHVNSLFQFEITDQWDDGWGPVCGADMLTDCWYITFSPCFGGCAIGASGLVAVSKKSGEIRYTGMVGE